MTRVEGGRAELAAFAVPRSVGPELDGCTPSLRTGGLRRLILPAGWRAQLDSREWVGSTRVRGSLRAARGLGRLGMHALDRLGPVVPAVSSVMPTPHVEKDDWPWWKILAGTGRR